MKISIVVPAFNEAKIIGSALEAIRSATQAFSGVPWELIVSDNNSTDSTAAIAKANGAKVVFEPVNQISRARNKGAEYATGDWLLFIDADSFPTAGLFESALRRMRRPDCAAGGCLVRLDESHFVASLVVAGWNAISVLTRWAAGSFVFCDARLFQSVGGFSNKLYASEEIDLCRRLKRAARQDGRRVFIITEERLITSARKMHLYSKREHFRFMLKAFLFPQRVLASREECTLWYNGRR